MPKWSSNFGITTKDMKNSKDLLTRVFYDAIRALDSYETVKVHGRHIRTIYHGGKFERLLVIGFGKAAYSMVRAMIDELGELINRGVLITKYGHLDNSILSIKESRYLHPIPSSFSIFEAGHPVPDEEGLKGTEEAVRLLKEADEHTLVLCLISGGGSSLLVSPIEGVTLREKQVITEMLLRSRADIYELNTVRKHISKVKGGRLVEIAYPATVFSLILSDVIGDRIDVIASGPTAPDETTFNDALLVLEKYRLMDKAPKGIINVIDKGAKGLLTETPKEGDKIFENVKNIVIGSNKIVLEAAKKRVEDLGFYAEIISSEFSGEARHVGRQLADIARSRQSRPSKPFNCLISGGETTVTVKGNGMGGRNMELALSFAMQIEGIEGITLLSAGTDGTDGPTDAAGAVVDGETVKKAKAMGLNPIEYLNNNDSYNFFKKIDGLFITGPTGTNVMDVQIIAIEGKTT